MALSFPSNPSVGQIFSSGTKRWQWSGEQWVAKNVTTGGGGTGTVTNVTGTSPISVVNGTTTPNVSISTVTTSSAGAMSAADKVKLDSAVTSSQNIGGSTGEGSIIPAVSKSGSALQFKKIKAGSGVSVTDGANDIIISMQNIGNYPYLEYAWVTAPNAAGQIITADAITTLNLTTRVSDSGLFGSVSSNQLTLAAGTYIFEAKVNFSLSINSSCIFSLYNVTDTTYITRSGSDYTDDHSAGAGFLKGQFTISSPKVLELRIIAAGGTTVVYNGTSVQSFQVSTANADQRTTIKLWKVG